MNVVTRYLTIPNVLITYDATDVFLSILLNSDRDFFPILNIIKDKFHLLL